MEENSDQTPEESPEKSEFQLKNEDFPVLQSTATPISSGQLKSEKKSARITNEPREITSGRSGTTMLKARISSMQVSLSLCLSFCRSELLKVSKCFLLRYPLLLSF